MWSGADPALVHDTNFFLFLHIFCFLALNIQVLLWVRTGQPTSIFAIGALLLLNALVSLNFTVNIIITIIELVSHNKYNYFSPGRWLYMYWSFRIVACIVFVYLFGTLLVIWFQACQENRKKRMNHGGGPTDLEGSITPASQTLEGKKVEGEDNALSLRTLVGREEEEKAYTEKGQQRLVELEGM